MALLVYLVLAALALRREPVLRCRAPRLTARQCVVLSVGGPAGLAHAGVLAELQRQNVPIDCVVGNSMGAVVGSLYASAPEADPVLRTRSFLHHYLDSVSDDAKKRAAVGAGGAALRSGLTCDGGGCDGALALA